MRTIFFGGAFDPFHSEHRFMVETAKEYLQADRVVVYPSFSPPHKKSSDTPFSIRMDMAKAGLDGLDYVVFDDIERKNDGINYSYRVLPVLKEKYPSDEWYFLMGGDSLVHFSSWVKPEEIARHVTLAVIAREDVVGLDEKIVETEKKYGATVRRIPSCGKAVSSSLVRTRAALGLPVTDVCKKVEDIIRNNGLYRDDAALITLLKSKMKPTRFEHVCRTVLYAVERNTELNLPYRKVFLAALLHDCTKHEGGHIEGVPDAVVHQYTGAERAKDLYGIDDEEILDAIRYHATGKPAMTTLGKLIFLADMLEEGRDFEGVEELREKTEKNFEEGFSACVKSCLDHLKKNAKDIDDLTAACAAYYNIE